MKRLFTLFGLAVVIVGCAPTTEVIHTTYDYAYQESSARLLDPDAVMMLSPIIADLNVSNERVTYVETEAFAHIYVTKAIISDIVEYKKLAVARAAQYYKADVMVGCNVDVVTRNKRLVITVSGYPAWYKNFRNATADDVDLVKNAQEFKSEEPVFPVETKGNLFEMKLQK